MRLGIIGGPGCGKSTLARAEAKRLGVSPILCTDTLAQSLGTGRIVSQDGVLFAPAQFDKDWSGLSRFVADNWLTKPGPWIIEGVALPRALRKWRERYPHEAPPVDRVIWCTEPLMDLSDGQHAMLSGHDTIANGLLEEWPELMAITSPA